MHAYSTAQVCFRRADQIVAAEAKGSNVCLQDLPSNALAPPKSGSYSELSFRRLLKNCDEIIAGDVKDRTDLVDWRNSTAFRQVHVATRMADVQACK